MSHGRFSEDRSVAWPAEVDDRWIYALVFDLTPESGYDEYTREAVGRFRDSGEVTSDWDQAWGGVKWRLRSVPVSDLHINYDYVFDDARARDYANLSTKAPPVVLGTSGTILDGQHRAVAAKYRGDSSVLAYVPVVAEGASGPLRHMVTNIFDSVTYCRAFYDYTGDRKAATADPSQVTCKGCKEAALLAHPDRMNPLADFLLGRKWRKPWRGDDE